MAGEGWGRLSDLTDTGGQHFKDAESDLHQQSEGVLKAERLRLDEVQNGGDEPPNPKPSPSLQSVATISGSWDHNGSTEPMITTLLKIKDIYSNLIVNTVMTL